MEKAQLLRETCEKALHTEDERTMRLEHKSERIFGAAALVLGYQVIILDRSLVVGTCGVIIYYVSYLALVMSLGLAAYSALVKKYFSYPRGQSIAMELDKPDTPQEASQALARLYLVIREENASVNDRRARAMQGSGWLLIVAIIFGSLVRLYSC